MTRWLPNVITVQPNLTPDRRFGPIIEVAVSSTKAAPIVQLRPEPVTCGAESIARVGRRLRDGWYRSGDDGALTWCGFDAQLAAHGRQPVGHALQSCAVLGRHRVEAGAVVGDPELEPAVELTHGHGGERGPGVLRHVLQCLEYAEVQRRLGVAGEPADPVGVDEHGHGRPAGLC